MVKRFHIIVFLLLHLMVGTASGEIEKLRTLEVKGYFRVTGGPTGAFYFLKKGSYEVNRAATNESFIRRLRGSQKLQTTACGKHYAVISYNNFRPTELEVTAIRLYDAQGVIAWSVDDPGCNSFILAEDTPRVVGVAGVPGVGASQLDFYDSDGSRSGQVEVGDFSSGAFTGDGRFFFAITGGDEVIKFSMGGRELQRYAGSRQFRVSHDGTLIALVSDTLLRVYASDSLLWQRQIDFADFREVRFRGDQQAMALLTATQLELVDLSTGQFIWRRKIADPDFCYVGLDSDAQFSHLVCSSNNLKARPEYRNTSGRVLLLDAAGHAVWTSDYSYVVWTPRYPEVRIDVSRRAFSVLTSEKFELFGF